MFLYDTLLVTQGGYVFALLSYRQLERIERAWRTKRDLTVIIRMESGREIEALDVLTCISGDICEERG